MRRIFQDISNSNSSTKGQYKELILYDGFMMQRLFETMINESESNTDHVHIVFEDRLICTFSEQDWRYHARTIVGGSPSVISTTGIVEAPAKPKEWYIKQMQLATYDICSEIPCNNYRLISWGCVLSYSMDAGASIYPRTD
jgi:hypothetical protein